MFDIKRETVARQRHTDHRLVHPTVNQWPHQELSLTTTLPFLEWSAGLCSTVTRSIANQFEHLRGSNRLFMETEIIDLSDVATGVVRVHTKPKQTDTRAYRLVIIAIGFGEEQTAPGFDAIDYWWPDRLENLVAANKIEDFLVSGCGDGGMIDALRVVHRDFAKGQLAYDAAALLSGSEIANAITIGELAARASRDPSNLADIYTAAAQSISAHPDYRQLSEKLENSLAGGVIVYLLDDKLDAPFSLNAAPVHKLLVAHAREKGKIRFRRGSAKRVGGDVEFAGLKIPAPPNSHVIIRHGPKFDFGRILSDVEIADLKDRQLRLADKQADPIWTEPYPVPPMLPARNPKDPAFIASRADLAKRAVRSLMENADILPLRDKLRAIYRGHIPAGAPSQLFGIPVENEIQAVIPGIGG